MRVTELAGTPKENPRVQCPGGEGTAQQALQVKSKPDSWFTYQCVGDGCVVADPGWENHDGLTELRCVASDYQTMSEPLVVYVPEPSLSLMYLVAIGTALAVYYVWPHSGRRR